MEKVAHQILTNVEELGVEVLALRQELMELESKTKYVRKVAWVGVVLGLAAVMLVLYGMMGG